MDFSLSRKQTVTGGMICVGATCVPTLVLGMKGDIGKTHYEVSTLSSEKLGVTVDGKLDREIGDGRVKTWIHHDEVGYGRVHLPKGLTGFQGNVTYFKPIPRVPNGEAQIGGGYSRGSNGQGLYWRVGAQYTFKHRQKAEAASGSH